jgi:hypothetical protein
LDVARTFGSLPNAMNVFQVRDHAAMNFDLASRAGHIRANVIYSETSPHAKCQRGLSTELTAGRREVTIVLHPAHT